MKKIILFILCFLYQNIYSQNFYINKNDAIKDLDSLKMYIEEIHPNPYSEKDKEEIYNIYDIIKNSIKDSISLLDFYNYTSYITTYYNDGHLHTIFPSKKYKTHTYFLPFAININEKKVIIESAIDSLSKYNGFEILEINNVNIQVIIDTFMKLSSGEAHHFKKEIVKYNFSNLLFSIYKFENQFSIKIKKDGLIETIKIFGQNKSIEFENPNENEIPFYKAIYQKNSCIIDFRDFSDLDNFKIFLDTVFTKIKKENIQNLIIDLRNNSGGNSSLGDELFQYIAKSRFRQYDKTDIKISRQLKILWEKSYLPNNIIDSNMYNTIKNLNNGLVINTDSIFENDNELITLRKNPNRFKGTIYLLTSNFTFSSASDFAWCFKHYKMGKIIGEETGGLGLCFGDNVYTKLPYSNLEINVSCKLFYNVGANENSKHGARPDVYIKSANALQYTLDLIKKSKNFQNQ